MDVIATILGGHSHWKGVWGCAAVMTPFFQASRRSLAHQFTLDAPPLCPLFSIFRKFLDFQPCFGQNSSSLDPNFSKFSFPRPTFFQENPLPRPYILKPAWHTPTKKKVECPPGLQCSVKSSGFTYKMGIVHTVDDIAEGFTHKMGQHIRDWIDLRPLKLDSVFSVTFLSAHNEATFSLFIIFVSISHQYQPFRMYIKDLNPTWQLFAMLRLVVCL